MKGAIKYIGVTFGILAVAVFIILNLLGGAWDSATETTTDLEEYEEVLSKWERKGLVDHFPSTIPIHAENVGLASSPGFLQGGGYMQLRLELSEEDVREIYSEASDKALQFHHGGTSVTLVNEREDGLFSTYPHTLGSSTLEFPTDYRIFVYHSKPTTDEALNKWNHGESKGMVISLERNELIYFAEKW